MYKQLAREDICCPEEFFFKAHKTKWGSESSLSGPEQVLSCFCSPLGWQEEGKDWEQGGEDISLLFFLSKADCWALQRRLAEWSPFHKSIQAALCARVRPPKVNLYFLASYQSPQQAGSPGYFSHLTLLQLGISTCTLLNMPWLSPLHHPDNFHQLLVCLTIESWSLVIGTKPSCLEWTNTYFQVEENCSRNLKNILKYMRKAEWFLWRWKAFWQSLTSHPRDEAGCFSGLPALTAGSLFPPWAAQSPLGPRVVWVVQTLQPKLQQCSTLEYHERLQNFVCIIYLFIMLVN